MVAEGGRVDFSVFGSATVTIAHFLILDIGHFLLIAVRKLVTCFGLSFSDLKQLF